MPPPSNRRPTEEANSADGGFLATDAAVGLFIVAMGLIGVIKAQSFALANARRAATSQAALMEARFNLEAEWPALQQGGARKGRSADLAMDWDVVSQPRTPRLQTGVTVCDLSSTVHIRLSGQSYTLRTARICGAASS
jgi:hypothetical protein